MFKKLGIVVLLLPMLCFAPAQANDYCDSCCDSMWEVYGDWLYWKPRCQSFDVATPFDSDLEVQIGTVQNLGPSYQSGFRIGALYECGDLFGDLFYTRFHHKYPDHVQGAFSSTRTTIDISAASSATFNANWSFDYDTVDLLAGTRIHNPCACFKTYYFGGLKLVFIDQEFTTNFLNNPSTFIFTTLSQKNKLDGYGLDFGLGMDYGFWNCLNFFTRISGDIFLAKFHRTFKEIVIDLETGDIATNVDLTDDYWNMASALNVMFGLGYDYRFSCALLGISVGYEFHQYFGISDWLTPFTLFTSGIRRDLQNLSLDGLFVRVSLGF